MNMLVSAPQWTQEEANAAPDGGRLIELRAAVSRSWRTRERLSIHDHSEIARICDKSGSAIRAWRDSRGASRADDAILQNLIQVTVV